MRASDMKWEFEAAKLRCSCELARGKPVALGMLWMRLLRESFLFAWWAIWANKLRTFLSLLGVMVGIFMISAVFTVVDSLEDNLKDTFNMLDEDVLFVQKWPWAAGGDYPWWKYVQRREPTQRALSILERCVNLPFFPARCCGNRYSDPTLVAWLASLSMSAPSMGVMGSTFLVVLPPERLPSM